VKWLLTILLCMIAAGAAAEYPNWNMREFPYWRIVDGVGKFEGGSSDPYWYETNMDELFVRYRWPNQPDGTVRDVYGNNVGEQSADCLFPTTVSYKNVKYVGGGRGYSFPNGTGDYYLRITNGVDVALAGKTNISIGVWWFQPGETTGGIIEITDTNTVTAAYPKFSINHPTATNFQVYLNRSTTHGKILAGYSPTNEWSHVVATYDGLNTKLYQDGVLVGTSTNYSAEVDFTGCHFNIGAFRNAGQPDGYFTEPFLYGRTFSSNEIKQIYDAGRTNWTFMSIVGTNGYVYYSPMTNDYLRFAEDITGASLFPIPTWNSCATVFDAGTNILGDIYHAVSFDGIDDLAREEASFSWPTYPEVPNNTNSFTIEGWVQLHATNSSGCIFMVNWGASAEDYSLRITSGQPFWHLDSVSELDIAKGFGQTLGDLDWHHIAVVRRCGEPTDLFIDGYPVASCLETNTINVTAKTMAVAAFTTDLNVGVVKVFEGVVTNMLERFLNTHPTNCMERYEYKYQ